MADRGLRISCFNGGLAELRRRGPELAVETTMPAKKSEVYSFKTSWRLLW